MPNKQTTENKTRKGDTSRTSSQGRKLSSGGDVEKKGNQEIDEASKAPLTESKNEKKSERNRP